MIDLDLKEDLKSFELFVEETFNQLFLVENSNRLGLEKLNQAKKYSLFSGGKRFRPLLCFAVARSFGVEPRLVYEWALAIEMIHTYSLIHDDLPAMDNDDFRRGLPTNHKVYGQDMALLAGDALLTEAFLLIAENSELVRLLVRAAGSQGMVGGQAIDLRSQDENMSLEVLNELHRKKTGALIAACVAGVAKILLQNSKNKDVIFGKEYYDFGEELGYLFQIQDDIFDAQQKDEKEKNICFYISENEANKLLIEKSQNLKNFGSSLFKETRYIFSIIEYNLKRSH